MQQREQLVEAILLNNPDAVSETLMAIGVLEDAQYLSPEDLKDVLHQAASYEMGLQSGNIDAYWGYINQVMDNVPVDPQGLYSAELLASQNQTGSYALLSGPVATVLPLPATSLKGITGGGWTIWDIIAVLAAIALALGIIHLIRKF